MTDEFRSPTIVEVASIAIAEVARDFAMCCCLISTLAIYLVVTPMN
jgi:hypothetical protein